MPSLETDLAATYSVFRISKVSMALKLNFLMSLKGSLSDLN